MLSAICPTATEAEGITSGASFSVKTDLKGGVASIFHSCKREGGAHSSSRLFSENKEQDLVLSSLFVSLQDLQYQISINLKYGK